jgi:hypothetical protein
MSNRSAVDQPTRSVDRNRSLAAQPDPATDEMLLPQINVEGGRGVPNLQSLVLKRTDGTRYPDAVLDCF